MEERVGSHPPAGPGNCQQMEGHAKLGRLSPEGEPGGSWPWSQNPSASIKMVLDPHWSPVPHSTAEKTEVQRGQLLN